MRILNFSMLIFSLLFITCELSSQLPKTRLIILADMGNEPDEEQQITHLLLYANEFDLEGLIAVSGKFLHSEHRLPKRRVLYPQLFGKIIDGYEQVFDNLKIHANGYPPPEYLRSIVASGHVQYGIEAVKKGNGNSGSSLIYKSIISKDSRPLYIVVNAGSNTLAQALVDLEVDFSSQEVKEMTSRIWVFENGAQDNSGAWIASRFPEIHWMRSNYQTYAYGGPAWAWGDNDNPNKGPYTWKPYEYSAIGQHQWILEHVKNHGAMSRTYPLRENHEGKLVFVEGGGTIPWLGLVHQGLSDFTHPNWGGWSGRFSASPQKNIYSRHLSVKQDEENYDDFFMYEEATDTWFDPSFDTTYTSIYVPVWRWRQAYFDDFKARMDWCIKTYESANHHPVAVVNSNKTEAITRLSVKAGENYTLDGSLSSDPDGDDLKYIWWAYNEAGSYAGKIKIANSDSKECQVSIPLDASGKNIHVILEVNDLHASTPLTDYRRVIFSVE